MLGLVTAAGVETDGGTTFVVVVALTIDVVTEDEAAVGALGAAVACTVDAEVVGLGGIFGVTIDVATAGVVVACTVDVEVAGWGGIFGVAIGVVTAEAALSERTFVATVVVVEEVTVTAGVVAVGIVDAEVVGLGGILGVTVVAVGGVMKVAVFRNPGLGFGVLVEEVESVVVAGFEEPHTA